MRILFDILQFTINVFLYIYLSTSTQKISLHLNNLPRLLMSVNLYGW